MYFSDNPYRVLGVLANSSIKDVKKNLSKLKAFAKIGKDMQLEYNFSCFNLRDLNRTDDLLLKSENSLNLDINRIKNSIFWFADLNPIDSVALSNLVNGDLAKTREIWAKATKSRNITEKNYSSYSNFSSFLLFTSLDDSKIDQFKKDENSLADLKLAIELKSNFLKSEFFNNYNDAIVKTRVLSSLDAQDYFTETILEILKKNFNTNELFKITTDELHEKLISSLTKEPILNINNHIDNTQDLIDKDTQENISKDKKGSPKGIKIGKKLIEDTKEDYLFLKDVFSADDFQFQIISDKLCNTILDCGIACFNSNIDNSYYQTYSDSFKYALNIAIEDKTKTRAEKAVKHCQKEASANICEFCKINDIASTFRVKMHKMKWDNTYTYFKDGGIELACCKKCKSEKLQSKYFSYILALLIYVGVNIPAAGVIFGVDLILLRFSVTKWWFKFLPKKMFFENVKSHSVIRMLEIDNYEFGMP